MVRLNLLGYSMKREMNVRNNSNREQYMVACILSQNEIQRGTYLDFLKFVESRFHSVKQSTKISMKKRYLKFERFVFLMNSKDEHGHGQHTEARLFDPKEYLRKQNTVDYMARFNGGNITAMQNSSSENEFLAEMIKDFVKRFGFLEDYYIVVFSHFLPCTQPEHSCAGLLGHFAFTTRQKVLLSYELPYITTNVQTSLALMSNGWITLIHPRSMASIETLQRWQQQHVLLQTDWFQFFLFLSLHLNGDSQSKYLHREHFVRTQIVSGTSDVRCFFGRPLFSFHANTSSHAMQFLGQNPEQSFGAVFQKK